MSRYYSNGGVYYTSNDCGCEIYVIIFGTIIIFMLLLVLIVTCCIFCRKNTFREGVIVRPMAQTQHGTVAYLAHNDQTQFVRSPNIQQVHGQQLMTAHSCEGQHCMNTAPPANTLAQSS